jgi:hypothetical protein
VSYPTVGRYQRTPVPPLWSFRWMAWLAVFASQVGVWTTTLVWDAGHWWVALPAALLSVLGVGIAGSRVYRGNLYARQLWTLCDNVYGPAADGATVILRPAPHPEVPGEVVVEYPE